MVTNFFSHLVTNFSFSTSDEYEKKKIIVNDKFVITNDD